MARSKPTSPARTRRARARKHEAAYRAQHTYQSMTWGEYEATLLASADPMQFIVAGVMGRGRITCTNRAPEGTA